MLSTEGQQVAFHGGQHVAYQQPPPPQQVMYHQPPQPLYQQSPSPQPPQQSNDTQRQLEELKRANEQLMLQQQMAEMKRQNEMLQLKMETQRDQQLRDMQTQQALMHQSTMMAMQAANSNRGGAAPITIQGPTISNASNGSGAPAVAQPQPVAVAQPPVRVVVPVAPVTRVVVALPPVAFDQRTGFPLCHAHCGAPMNEQRGDGAGKGNCHRCGKALTANFWRHVHKGKMYTLCNGHGQLCTACVPFPGSSGDCCVIL